MLVLSLMPSSFTALHEYSEKQEAVLFVFLTLFFVLCLYRAVHFSAKRGIAIECRLSVYLSVTLVNCDHIGWNSSKIISPLVSMGRLLFATQT